MTSPSYSSASSLHSTSSSLGSYVQRKPSYDPPNWDWSQPSTSGGPIGFTDKTQRKVLRPVYSPSSPSSDSSTSDRHFGHSARPRGRGKSVLNTSQCVRTPPSRSKSYSEAFSNPQKYHKSLRPNHCSKKYKKKSTFAAMTKLKQARQVASDFLANHHKTKRFHQSCSNSPSIPPAQSGIHSATLHPSRSRSKPPVPSDPAPKSPTSPLCAPSSLTSSHSLPTYSSPVLSPESIGPNHSFSPNQKLHKSEFHTNTKGDSSPEYSESMSKRTPSSTSKLLRSPVYSPSSPSPSYSPTSCPYSSPKYSPSSKNLSCAESSNQVIPSPSYSPSSPSKPPSCLEFTNMKLPHSPVYSPSSPSLPHSLTSSPQNLPFSPTKKQLFLFSPSSMPCQPSLSHTAPSPTYSASSPSKAPPSPCEPPPSPSFTPSSPSKPPPSPSLSPGFHSSPSTSPCSVQDNLNNEIMTFFERKAKSPPRPTGGRSFLYSPVSSQSPVYSSDSSSKLNKMLKKRVKLQRSSPTSPGSVVSELMEIGVSKSSSSRKLKFYPSSNSQQVPCSSVHQSGNESPELSMPSPKYSPSSKMISSEVSEAVVPPYSPSSPSHPPPSPSLNPSSPPSPVSSDRFSLSKVKGDYTPEPTTSYRPPSFGSPHYSLDSLSSYSSSSFSSGLPSPSSGSPRYSPSPSESEALLNHQLTPSPPVSPAVTLTSPRVSSSSSSSPARETPPELSDPPHSQESNHPPGVALPAASLSMFSPSLSPQLPQFSPSSPSHQPPSPAYSPSSPSYSSGSCSPSGSTSSSHLGNTLSSSPRSSHSSTSIDPPTVVLKLFIPKST